MCWKCGNDISIGDFVQRSAECPTCHADLHSCKNCVFYSPGSHYDCHETVFDAVHDKERANFCESFKIKTVWKGSASAFEKAQKAKKAAEALFG